MGPLCLHHGVSAPKIPTTFNPVICIAFIFLYIQIFTWRLRFFRNSNQPPISRHVQQTFSSSNWSRLRAYSFFQSQKLVPNSKKRGTETALTWIRIRAHLVIQCCLVQRLPLSVKNFYFFILLSSIKFSLLIISSSPRKFCDTTHNISQVGDQERKFTRISN